jgi:predicted solute-binding protein
MSNKNNTAVQLSVVQSTTVVALAQTVSQVGVVSNGKIKSADISSTNKVGKKGNVVSTTTVSLKF